MSDDQPLHPMLADASVASDVLALRPDYRALLVVATGIRGGPTDAASDAALLAAEERIRGRLSGEPPETLPEIAAWREAFLGFGVKPRAARSSVEALVRRIDTGLPRINRLTDLYNAISVAHLVPLGGENLDAYAGAPRLVQAAGDEAFDTVADGEPVTVTPDPGEVVWRDDLGVTCRRWNWRQCVRTRLDEHTVNALFILDGLDPLSDEALLATGDALIAAITAGTPGADAQARLIGS